MRQLFVFKDTNYGASKTSATLNTATTPDQLADGAIGIYGIDPVLNAGNLSLIVDAASSSGFLIGKADYKGTEVRIFQGTSDGVRLTAAIPLADKNLKLINNQAYSAGTKGVSYIGYNSITATGSLNLPAVISRGDEAIMIVNLWNEVIGKTTVGRTYSGYANQDGEDGYDILTDMLVKIYAKSDREIDVDIVGNLVGTTDIGGTSSTFVHGSTAVVHTGTDHLITALDYITVSGVLYQVVVDGGTGAYTLDRPYRGVSATIVVANIHDQGATAATEFGLRVTDKDINQIIKYSLTGVIESAVLTYQVPSVRSTGRGVDVLALETVYKPHRGQLDNINSYMPQPLSYAIAGTNYDLYNIVAGSDLSNSDHMGYGKVGHVEMLMSFVTTVADTAGKNQSDFEDIMTVFYPDFVTLF